MGLENLKSVFNDIKKNELPDYGGRYGQGVHGGITNEFPSTPHYEHSEYGNISENLLSRIQSPNSEVAGKISFGNPNTTDYSLGTGIHSGLETYDNDNIKKRSFDITTLGKDQQLGLGDYVLESLYNTNHTAVINRQPIDTGRQDFDGNPILINTARAGMGELGKLDIKGYSSTFRQGGSFGFGDGREPYIVNDIGSDVNTIGNNRDLIPIQASLEDTSRLLKFYSSTAGLTFSLKENGISFLTRDFSLDNPSPLGPTYIPPVPTTGVGNTSILNVLTMPFQSGIGSSIRRPFEVEYSKRGGGLFPFKNLGDSAGSTKSKLLNTKFFDLSGFGEHNEKVLGQKIHGYDDKINQSGVEEEKSLQIGPVEFPAAPLEISGKINSNDFYVRFKDTRDNTYIYFRGFVTGITENVSPSFTSTNYIGRSEPVYMYERAERDISFTIRVYPNNEEEFVAMYEKIERLTSLAYPKYEDDVNDNSLTRMKPPFTELYMAHIGQLSKGQFGYIKSLSYTVNESGDWDAETRLPRLFDIAVSYQILSKKPPSLRDGYKFYGARPNG